MAHKISTALRNYKIAYGSVKQALTGGVLRVYSGSLPAGATADAAIAGTLLCEYTLASGAHTPAVLARGKVTLATGGSGSVDSITVNGVELLAAPVAFTSSLDATATAVVAAINANMTYPDYKAIKGGTAEIIIEAMPGSGTGPNGFDVTATCTTITTTDVNMGTTAAGVAAVNGLTWGAPSAGVISKSGVWSGIGLADGTPGCFSLTGPIADANGDDSSNLAQFRVYGTVSSTPGTADLILSEATIVTGVTNTIDTFTLTEPASA